MLVAGRPLKEEKVAGMLRTEQSGYGPSSFLGRASFTFSSSFSAPGRCTLTSMFTLTSPWPAPVVVVAGWSAVVGSVDGVSVVVVGGMVGGVHPVGLLSPSLSCDS